MPDIVELERRIRAALDRIDQGLEAAPAHGGTGGLQSSGKEAELLEELEIERATIERMVATREKHTARIERMETRQMRMVKRIETLSVENQRLQTLVDMLQDANRDLRAGQYSESADAEALAQIEDLKARRQADLDELDEMLAELSPLVAEEATHA
ncbi:MAG: hypothetical protein AAGA12_13360 [Pseudomonadota bacterium]